VCSVTLSRAGAAKLDVPASGASLRRTQLRQAPACSASSGSTLDARARCVRVR
jgi:hypothetical protein